MDKKKEIKYMLERTASLILTDCRFSSDLNNIDSEIGLTHKANGQEIYYIPCMLSLNIVKLWPSFKKTIFRNLKKYCQLDHVVNKKTQNINWNKTFENILKGINETSFKENQEVGLFNEYALVYWVSIEFLMHVEEITLFFTQNSPPKSLAKTRDTIILIKNELCDIINEINIPNEFDLLELEIKENLASQFRLVITDSLDYNNFLDKYLANSSELFYGLEVHNLIEFAAIEWRKEYLSLNTGLGSGKDILIEPTTDIPHLYELWCFYEFIAVLVKKNKLNIAQFCYINSNKNLKLFSIENAGSIYYNYLGEKTSNIAYNLAKSKILKRTCVEWFIEFKNLRIVFDTKYKNWSSSDNLTVLGYMNDFNADVGVVIFSDNFNSSAYNSMYGNDKIICTSFSQEEKFVALQLHPSNEQQIVNENTLSILVDFLLSNKQTQPNSSTLAGYTKS